MPAFYRKLLSAIFAFGFVCNMSLADSEIEPGIEIQFEHSHQNLSSGGADGNTVDIAPYLQYGNWDFTVDAPWVSADADYVNNQFPPRFVKNCDKYSQYTAFAQKHPKSRVAKLLAACDALGVLSADDTVSGMSDITAFVHYNTALDDQAIWLLSVGAGYKFDNGDADKNLGSGTRNTMLEATLGATYGKFSGALTGGYAFIDGGDELVTESHYGYASIDLNLTPIAWAIVGITVDYDQSYMASADDVTKVTAYIKFKPWQHVHLKIYARDYSGATGYPDSEYGGSVSLVY